ncbi:uncharacterized protein Gasu_34440 [Galdieria sulphuraria]|uniref:Uncharacterized protein n=1 Tax=Galdieria sulphuraria TaxID=130081 RepID=M2XZH0_GALSU|nr:uncharacterized protein Gasu_34440 [Galdieria sulphuraria]EME29048.1 hypothetical protein Gasu_34440 [Galdieria sulphuraria]|eukprot:XP_005705568.1 hypothetical protein Gasu_34440 [Galdieria sulphuraria]
MITLVKLNSVKSYSVAGELTVTLLQPIFLLSQQYYGLRLVIHSKLFIVPVAFFISPIRIFSFIKLTSHARYYISNGKETIHSPVGKYRIFTSETFPTLISNSFVVLVGQVDFYYLRFFAKSWNSFFHNRPSSSPEH